MLYFWSMLQLQSFGQFIKRQSCHHVETSLFIRSVNQLTVFNRAATFAFNTFHATDLFWYPLKASETLWFFDVFRGYQKRPVAWNGFTSLYWVFILSMNWLIYTPPAKPHDNFLIFKKLYGPFLWMGFSCLKATATSRRQFTFYHYLRENQV